MGVQFSMQALEVHKSLNCVTVFLSDCEDQLKKLRESGVKGPLYGVPVSIKEHVGYQVIFIYILYLSSVEPFITMITASIDGMESLVHRLPIVRTIYPTVQ